MKIVVPVKLVPDLVEELVIDESGLTLDALELSLCLNEFDDHAIEQAILLKEEYDCLVTVIAPDMEEADDVLFSAAAKGADKLLRLSGDFDENTSNHTYARMLAPVMRELEPDLILTGVQAHNDLDGQLGPLLAEHLHYPYIGYVSGVQHDNGQVTVGKEYPGGLRALFEVKLPAVLGIQAAAQPPRYIAFSRVRQAMNTAVIEEKAGAGPQQAEMLAINRLYQPVRSSRATMLKGEADEVAAQLLALFSERGYLRRE